MGAAKPSKKQRGTQKKALKVKARTLTPVALTAKTTGLGVSLKPAKDINHVKFGEDGETTTTKPAATGTVSVVGKKRARAAGDVPAKAGGAKKEETAEAADEQAGGKSDRSPEMIQSAKYYLEQWKKRNEPAQDGEEQWKFKKVKQLWILRWMFEADVIPKSLFTLVLEYLDGLQGVARQRVLESANEIIDAGVPEVADEEDVASRLARRRYKRAMQVAELLS